MSKLFFEQVNRVFPSALQGMVGYSSNELRRIEKLYDIIVSGEFEKFMIRAGRCDGGVIGDDPLIVYRPTWSVRGQVLFQVNFFLGLQEIGAWEYLNKPFVFALEDETQYYFLQTGAAGDEAVYHYDENSLIVRRTEMTFSEYLVDILTRYPHGRTVCRGELLII